jgi:hypothetical protein
VPRYFLLFSYMRKPRTGPLSRWLFVLKKSEMNACTRRISLHELVKAALKYTTRKENLGAEAKCRYQNWISRVKQVSCITVDGGAMKEERENGRYSY